MDNVKTVDITLSSSTRATDRVDEGRIKDIKFYSRDRDSAYFRFTFLNQVDEEIVLDDGYKITVLYTFQSDNYRDVTVAKIEEGKAIAQFDTSLIKGFDYVNVNIYLENQDISIDSHAFKFKVDLSEIDKDVDFEPRPSEKPEDEPVIDMEEINRLIQESIEKVVIEKSVETEEFIQSMPLDIWTINHSLGKYPSVTVIDSGNQEMEGADITYISKSLIEIKFASPFSGRAILN